MTSANAHARKTRSISSPPLRGAIELPIARIFGCPVSHRRDSSFVLVPEAEFAVVVIYCLPALQRKWRQHLEASNQARGSLFHDRTRGQAGQELAVAPLLAHPATPQPV